MEKKRSAWAVLRRVGGIAIAAAMLWAAVPRGEARAASLVVDTLNDGILNDGICTLREAIMAANSNASFNGCSAAGFGDDTITFSVKGTITLGSDLPNAIAAQSLTIDGTGQNITINGNDLYRSGPGITGGAMVRLINLTFRNGLNDYGGAIDVHGALSVIDCTFKDNQAVNGGALDVFDGSLYVEHSTFTGNQATGAYGYGGGIDISALDGTGPAIIRGSTFTGNSAVRGGGAINSAAGLDVSESTFASNSAGLQGGAINVYAGETRVSASLLRENTSGYGSGIRTAYGAVSEAVNSTFWRNTGTDHAAGMYSEGTASVVNSTLSGNTIGVDASFGGTAVVANSIVTDSVDDNCYTLAGGVITNGGNNLENGLLCGWDGVNGSIGGEAAHLLALADNGGPTLTMALDAGSPAIDGVTWNPPNGCPFYDQRGVPRATMRCDIGACETDAGSLVFLPVIGRDWAG